MKLIDVIILSLCLIGLIYFAFDRFKYSSKKIYRENIRRLDYLRKIIAAIENDNIETEKIIKSINVDTVYDDETINKFINYRNNEDELNILKTELKQIEKYIKNFRIYNKHEGII